MVELKVGVFTKSNWTLMKEGLTGKFAHNSFEKYSLTLIRTRCTQLEGLSDKGEPYMLTE